MAIIDHFYSGNLPLVPALIPPFVLFLVYTYIITPYLFDRLSEIPNAHWSVPISRLWILSHRRKQDDTFVVHAAHTELGPVVRLGPNEISVNSVEGGIRTVYGGGYEKGDWYKNVFTNYGVMPMFAMPDHNMHSKRKRMMSNIYAKSTLQQSASLRAASKTLLEDRLRVKLDTIAEKGEPVEWYQIVSALTMDFVNAYIFGLDSGSDFLRQPGRCAEFLKSYKMRQNYTFWPQEMPLLTYLLHLVGLGTLIVPSWVHRANAGIEKWVLEMTDKSEKVLNAIEEGEEDQSGDNLANYPTVYAQMRNSILKEQSKLSDDDLSLPVAEIVRRRRLEIASEMLDHSMAGFDTSGITLTYLTWELSKPQNKHWQEGLREEIKSLGGNSPPTAKAIDLLPILHAILMETLRLHAAIPGNQPRITPPNATLGGSPYYSEDDPESKKGGLIWQRYTNLPAATRVNAQAWSLHRNPDVFPSPETWNPARWIPSSFPEGQSTDEQLKEMGRWFWAFGSGGRMCVGSNLAMQEMKGFMALVWGPNGFETEIAGEKDGWGKESMTHNGGYLAEPVGDKRGGVLGVRLKKVAAGR